MNLNKLSGMQYQLDAHIIQRKGLRGRDLTLNTIYALQVEVAELANEVRFFKHWSNNRMINPVKALEEYVDGLHFFLSLGNGMGMEWDHDFSLEKIGSIRTTFASITKRLSDAWWNYHDNQIADYRTNWLFALQSYLHLGGLLGFTEEAITQAYKDKNAKNYLRQKSGY
ncbi:dUTP diphosphatase [Sediminibacillus massiliensis]|uniref:dUTP diphosphatase n=1 Tax=Sediminibacillus massiliensis TaxID=1926277 RepID=UPI0009888CE4|nr:dUTP diphosphatase [Sediminibacillus massiliensis]